MLLSEVDHHFYVLKKGILRETRLLLDKTTVKSNNSNNRNKKGVRSVSPRVFVSMINSFFFSVC